MASSASSAGAARSQSFVDECEVEVICAGFGRCGNTSFQKAIDILGFGPCYHMDENFGKGHAKLWSSIADQEINVSIHDVLGKLGYRASCDFPATVYWSQQLERYPHAKVVLLERDAEEWYTSFMNTIAHLQPDNPDCPFLIRVAFGLGLPCAGAAEMIHKVISRDAFNNKWNKEDMIRAYLDFGANVKETCPKDQLLVFSVTQGWEPLCAFLNVPVPSVPFPRLNSTADYAQMQIKIATVGAAACVIGLGIPALLAQQSLLDPSEIRHHEKMKAAVYTKFASKKEEEGAGKAGDFANITVKKLSKPIAKPGFAVVKVMAAAINPLDAKVARGYIHKMGWNMPCPFVPGYDFAGIISSLHPLDENSAATTGLRVGERVCGVNFGAARHDEPGCPVGGAFAEYMAVPLSKLSRLPDELSFSSAAGIGLAGCTAYQMLFDIAKIKAGDRILILGGATSVGMIAIQLAKSAGAWVAATCSARGEDFLRSLALLPDEILPYQATDSQPSPSLKAEDRWDVRDSCKDLHAVLDIVGEAGTFAKVKAAGMVRQGGVFMSLSSFEVGFQPQAHLPAFSWAAKYGYSQSTSQQNEVLALLAKKKIKLPIHATYPFTTEGVQAMFQQVDGMKSLGKNILSVVDEKEENATA